VLRVDLVDHLEVVVGPDHLAEIIEELEDDKRLFRRPVVGEVIDEAGLEGRSGHVLAPPRTRVSARSCASLWR
jgi:hypothetical protein